MNDLVISFTESNVIGLNLPPDMPLDRWVEFGKTLKTVEKHLLWMLGDWINYGETNYGEKYKDALEQTGYEYGTLRNIASVARSIELSRRSDKLTFAHHAEVAALPPAEQDKWLDKAEREDLSRSELRHSIHHKRVIRADEIQEASGRATAIPNMFGMTIPYMKWSNEVLGPKLSSDDAQFLIEAREFLEPFAADYERVNARLAKINGKGMMAV